MEVSLEWIYSRLRLSRTARGSPLPRLLWMNSTCFPSTPVCAPLLEVQPLCPYTSWTLCLFRPFQPSPSPHTCHQAIKQANISPVFCHHLNILIALEMLWNLSSAPATEWSLPSSSQLRPSLSHRPGELSSTWSLSSLKAGAFLSGSLPQPVFKEKKRKDECKGGQAERKKREKEESS